MARIVAERLRRFDGWFYCQLHARFRSRRLDPVMVAFTDVGTKSGIWLAMCACLALFGSRKGRRVAALTVVSTLTAQGVVNIVLKPLFRRRRPYDAPEAISKLLIRPPRAHSWPSGHAASSAAALTILAASYPEDAAPLVMLALAISYSRVYVGVHYPFDVAAGALIGFVVGGVCFVAVSQLEEALGGSH